MPSERSRRIVWLAGLLLALIASEGLAADAKRIVLLHSYGGDFKPWSEYATAIRNELTVQSRWPIDVLEHALIAARSADEGSEPAFVQYLLSLHANKPPDLIIALGAPAVTFMQRRRAEIFPNTPVLFAAVDRRFVQPDRLGGNATAVSSFIDLSATFRGLLQVLPDTKRVAVMIGATPASVAWREALQRELAFLDGKVDLVFYNELSFERMLGEVANLPPHSAIFWTQVVVDATGGSFVGDTALRRTFAVANAPLFSFDDSFFNGEIIGGPMLSVAATARKTGEVAVRVLGGEDAGSITTEPMALAPPKYDWRQLRRWHISEARLPPGSEVLFREPSAWSRYRWPIVATIAALLLQGLLIGALLDERRRRRKAEIESQHRLSELAHSNRHSTAGELSSSITHELSQPLGAILANAEAGEMLLEEPSPDLDAIRSILADIRRDDHRAGEVISRMRSLLTKRGFELKTLDLSAAIDDVLKLLSAFVRQRGAELTRSPAPAPIWVRGDAIQLQQVVLNLIINSLDAMEASAQRKVLVRADVADELVEVSIADTGPGIPPDRLQTVFDPFFTTKPDGMGIGLSVVRTIIGAHSGRIWAETAPGGGAVFRFSLPIAASH